MDMQKDYRLYDAMSEGYFLLDLISNEEGIHIDGQILECNRQMAYMVNKPCEELIGKRIKEVLPSLDEYWEYFVERFPKQKEIVQFDFEFYKIKKVFHINCFKPSSGQVILLCSDITLQSQAETALQLHEVLFENANDIILYIELDGHIINANKRACEQYGYTKEEFRTLKVRDIRHPSTMDQYEEQMKQANSAGITFECIHVRQDNTSFPVEVSVRASYIEKGRFRIHIIRDITLRKKNEEKIAWLAKYDALTEIPNRGSFLMSLEEEIKNSLREQKKFAIMLFDIDRFKTINDRYGHETGDEVLKHVANKTKGILSDSDIIGRLGGDEFVVLQRNILSKGEVITLAEKIQSAVNQTFHYKGIKAAIHISIGISLFPEDDIEEGGLLQCADKAMYYVKNNGGRAYEFFDHKEIS